MWNCLSPAMGFPYKVLLSPSCSLLFSFLFDQMLFPLCLVGRQARLPGSGLPFKCCFYCSTVTDHWPETGVAMEASTPCCTHTFPNDAHWKGDFLLVWNSRWVWHMKLLLLWMQKNWAYKTRTPCVRSDEVTVMCNFGCIIKWAYFSTGNRAQRILFGGETYFC